MLSVALLGINIRVDWYKKEKINNEDGESHFMRLLPLVQSQWVLILGGSSNRKDSAKKYFTLDLFKIGIWRFLKF